MKRVSQMRKIRIALVVSIFYFSVVTLAAGPLEERGYEIAQTRQDSESVRLFLNSPTGNRIEVTTARASLTEQQVDVLDMVQHIVYNLKSVDIRSLSLLFESDRVDILIVPVRITYNGQDLLPHLPSGLQFRFEEVLEYDFRVIVEDYFIRFWGQYINEKAFISRLAEAINNPVAFLESQRPELIARRLYELEDLFANASRAYDKVIKELNNELDITNKNLNRAQEELVIAGNHRENLETRTQTLGEQRLETQRELDTAKHLIEELRYALVAFNNKSLFGRVRPVEKQTINRIIKIYQDNPEIEAKEIRSVLSDEEIKASRNEIRTVLSVYLNHFE